MASPLEALEARVAALEARLDAGSAHNRDAAAFPAVGDADVEDADAEGAAGESTPYALLDELEASQPGTVAVVGSLDVEQGPVRWQYSLPAGKLAEMLWEEKADMVAALGSADRLGILRAVLPGERRVADLLDELGLASPGRLNHHVRVLTAAGWLESAGRGVVRIPPARIVPLLAVIVALH